MNTHDDALTMAKPASPAPEPECRHAGPARPGRRQALALGIAAVWAGPAAAGTTTAATAAIAAIAAIAATAATAAAAAQDGGTLRYAFRVAETGFDPAKISDLYSRIVTQHIFEALFHYDHLARPVKIKPLTAAALPEVSADFRRYTVQVRPGIYFADDPAFKGQKRELVAQDYVFSLKRMADPATNCPVWSEVEELGLLGLNAQRQRCLTERLPFDYDADLPGLRTLDRDRKSTRLNSSHPRLSRMPSSA